MDMNLLMQSLIDGILMGGIYGLFAVGLTLIFGVMKMINFAQGSFMMLGMYVTYWMTTKMGINPYIALPVAAFVLFLLGMFIQRFILERTIGADDHNLLLVTMGIMMVIENLALIVWKPDPRSINIASLQKPVEIGSLLINKPRGIAFLFTVALTVFLFWMLKRTTLGKSIRATANNLAGAATVGINVRRINYISFGIGVSLAGIAGCLIAPFFYATPTVGSSFVIKGFVVVVLGGLGNFVGALLGGLLIGVAESMGGAVMSGTWKDIVTFVLFILVLMFRPTGILGGAAKK